MSDPGGRILLKTHYTRNVFQPNTRYNSTHNSSISTQKRCCDIFNTNWQFHYLILKRFTCGRSDSWKYIMVARSRGDRTPSQNRKLLSLISHLARQALDEKRNENGRENLEQQVVDRSTAWAGTITSRNGIRYTTRKENPLGIRKSPAKRLTNETKSPPAE